uniref:Uncharacterized protein n=1 Tax=Arundo donax TaxID=35708 RepID=A0A0A8YD95_ARUDO
MAMYHFDFVVRLCTCTLSTLICLDFVFYLIFKFFGTQTCFACCRLYYASLLFCTFSVPG